MRHSRIEWLDLCIGSKPGEVGGSAKALRIATPQTSIKTNIKAQWGFPLEALRGLPEWKRIYNAFQIGGRTTYRRMLSYHTHTVCQPLKKAGAVVSLKSLGIDTPIEMDLDGIQVRIVFPDAYSFGDGLGWQITSGKFPCIRQARKDLCKTAVMWLLANHPDAVVLGSDACWVADARLSGAAIHM